MEERPNANIPKFFKKTTLEVPLEAYNERISKHVFVLKKRLRKQKKKLNDKLDKFFKPVTTKQTLKVTPEGSAKTPSGSSLKRKYKH